MAIANQLKQNTVGLELDIASVSPFEWIGGAMTALTGLVHLYLYWSTGFVLFLLAGAGFFGAVGLLFTTFSQRLLYALGIPYIGIQIVLWVTSGMQNFGLGVFDKTIQTLLIGLLVGLLLVELEIDFIEKFSALWDESKRRNE